MYQGTIARQAKSGFDKSFWIQLQDIENKLGLCNILVSWKSKEYINAVILALNH